MKTFVRLDRLLWEEQRALRECGVTGSRAGRASPGGRVGMQGWGEGGRALVDVLRLLERGAHRARLVQPLGAGQVHQVQRAKQLLRVWARSGGRPTNRLAAVVSEWKSGGRLYPLSGRRGRGGGRGAPRCATR